MKTKVSVALLAIAATCAAVLGWSKKSPKWVEANSSLESASRARHWETAPKEVKIHAEVNGRIREMRVEEGERVQRGQVIAILENTDSTARVAEAEARLAEREAQLAHVSSASASHSTSEELQNAKAEVERARAQFAEARTGLLKTFIRSPMDGLLLRKNVKPGENVFTNRPDGWIVTIQAGLSR
jgi:multidrug resistance efflux pump